jgi:hypothetical protein
MKQGRAKSPAGQREPDFLRGGHVELPHYIPPRVAAVSQARIMALRQTTWLLRAPETGAYLMRRRISRCQVSGNAPDAGGRSRSEREQYGQPIPVQAIDPNPWLFRLSGRP